MTPPTTRDLVPRAVLAGRSVRRVGYGVMQLAERGDRAAVDRADAVALLRRAVELGVEHVDTAGFYGDGLADDLLREALAPYRGVTVVTKVGAEVRPGHGLRPAQRAEELRAQVHAGLRSLRVERLDVVNLRRMDRAPGLVASGEQRVDLDDQLAELVALREAGLVGAIGLSNVTVDQLDRALPVGVACVQNAHSVLDRSEEPVLARCREHDVAWVPYFPLGSAFAGLPSVADDPVVREVAAAHDATPAQVGLAWLLHRDPRTLLIPGTASRDHLEENLAAGDLVLTAEGLAALEAVGRA